jgi:hypothetical protein
MPLEMKYFILKPGGSGPHHKAARAAMVAYAKAIRPHDCELADSLQEWSAREEIRAFEPKQTEEVMPMGK